MQKRLYVRGHAVDYTSLQCSRSAAPRGHGSRGIVPLREGKGFETLERPLDLPGVALSRQYDGILFEDLGNLLANELFSPDGAKQNSVKSILFGIRKLKENCKTLVVVSNEIFSDGEAYPPETMEYIRMLAELHVRITQEAGAVFESVCGILLPIKGGFEV